MSERVPLIAGNWKMNLTPDEGRAWCDGFKARLATPPERVEIAVCPPFTALEAVVSSLVGYPAWVGSQTIHSQASGAHTGEISAEMVLATGAVGTILGHSERREAGETDEMVATRVRRALDAGLRVILCVGERLEQREAGETDAHVRAQVAAALARVDRGESQRIDIAYEPIWAIGTGRTATPEIAQETCAVVRDAASAHVDGGVIRVLYGGSVNDQNAAELLSQADIDGALVGGASLDVEKFAAIVEAA
ncbi:MAG: triose-phosphate isomerase [Actinobacteria bacterium]|nr:triose-phosphate isomerase [Actinomycetota bacterium]